MFKRIISLALSVVFSLQTCGFAQAAQLNLAGYLGQGLSSVSLDRFHPASLRYFSYEPKTDNFQILLDKADEKGLSDTQVKDKADELMKYFRIGLSLPNDKFWVNLRPDAPEQIIDPELEQTDIGKIMLESDLELKKDTASFTSPQTKEGKEYWDKLYQKAGELFGSENITIPTLTRPWIVPGEIIVRESGDSGSTPLTTSAYIYKAALKVLLEEDYLKSSQPSDPNYQPLTSNYNFSDPRLKELNQYSTQLIRELILPKLTKEINRSKRYAGLRQVFYSLILARWFKGKFQGQSPSGTVPDLIDSGNLDNLTSQKPWSKDTYYREYKKSFEQGEYNLSETVHTPTGQLIRRYVSGGVFNLAAEPTGGYKETVGSAIVKPVNGALLNLNGNYIKETKIAASPLTVEEAKNAAIQKIRKTNIKEIDEKYVPRIKTAESFEHIYNQIVKFTLENEKKIKKEDMRELINEKERLERYIAADYFKQNGITVDLIRQQTRRIMIAAGRQAELNQPVDMYIDFKASGEYFKGWRNMKMHIHENAEDIKKNGVYAYTIIVEQKPDWGHLETYFRSEFFPDDDVVVTFMPEDPFLTSADRLYNVRKLAESIKGVLSKGSASSAMEEKEIIEANKTELAGIMSRVFEQSRNMEELDKEVWKIRLEHADDLLAVKKVCDDIITWINKNEPKIGKKSLEVFYGSLKEIIIEKFPNPSTQVSVATDEMKEKLNNLEQSRPELGEAVWKFGKFLSNRLNPKINPMGFILAAQLAIYDLQKGIDGFTDKPINNHLIGYPSQVYAQFSMSIPIIAKAVAPEDFAKQVEEIYKSLGGASSSLTRQVGGIDFRSMNMLIQPMGSFSGLDFAPVLLSSSALEAMDLDKELESITRMASRSMLPSPQRLKEYISACIFKGKVGEKADDFILSMLEVFQLQAEEGIESAPAEREAVVMADTRSYVLPEERLAAGNNHSLN